MAQKLSWTELRRALAVRAGVSEKTANAFLTALSSQLTEALKRDKQVKINGLGIFKLQAVAPRKSVNVTTGEQIIIEGYNKVTFSPEAGVKEMVESKGERTTAKGEKGKEKREEPVDPLQKLGAQAEEIVDILEDLGQSPKKRPAKPKKKEKPAEQPKEPEVPEKPEIPEVPEKPAEPVKPVEPEKPAEPEKPKKKKKEHHFLRDVLICVTLLLILLFGGYFFFRSQLGNWIEHLLQAQPPIETVDPAVVPETPAVIEETETEAKETEAAEPKETPAAEMAEPVYEGWITTEPMHKASRLAWMSKRYYGSKVYWPYLYDANKDRLANPNMIEVGTPIRVPKLSAVQLDTTNAQTRATLERLKKQALER